MTKEKIVQAVMKIIAAEGMKGLTTRRICTEANVAKGTLYHHFQNMDDLLLKSVKHISDKMMVSIEAMKFKDVEDFFTTIGLFAIDSVEQQKKNGLRTMSVFDELINNPNLYKATQDVHRMWIDISTEKIMALSPGNLSREVAYEISMTFNIVVGGFKSILYFQDDLEFVKKLWLKHAKQLAKYVNEEKWREE
ncbi:MAG TPA: TetR/AcrR family transcriptional regulator [bacterium]|jgi:AcrR family transcriptional regulator|nr:TetR/AcrR family transcriptional regulator [bacterium]HQI05316.1 TetR/AcrR family transcriptional regulator [bacterium]HQO92499.1 TetR/AcrR family transcriptional regulator [bacterium]